MVTLANIVEIRSRTQLREYPLESHVLRIGRRSNNEIVLTGSNVSRYHAKLKWRQGILCILDLSSSNGTILNGHKIESMVAYPLNNNDVIEIGDSKLTLRLDNEQANDHLLPGSYRPVNGPTWVWVALILLIISALAFLVCWFVPMAMTIV